MVEESGYYVCQNQYGQHGCMRFEQFGELGHLEVIRCENSVSFLEKWQICLAVKWDCYLNLQKGYCKFRGRVEISAPFDNSTAQLRRQ